MSIKSIDISLYVCCTCSVGSRSGYRSVDTCCVTWRAMCCTCSACWDRPFSYTEVSNIVVAQSCNVPLCGYYNLLAFFSDIQHEYIMYCIACGARLVCWGERRTRNEIFFCKVIFPDMLFYLHHLIYDILMLVGAQLPAGQGRASNNNPCRAT